MRVLFGNAPQSYREALAAALGALRPEIDVMTVTPAELDAVIALAVPDFVICSELTHAVETQSAGWALLYPDGSRASVLTVRGERSNVASIEFETLLATIDCIAG